MKKIGQRSLALVLALIMLLSDFPMQTITWGAGQSDTLLDDTGNSETDSMIPEETVTDSNGDIILDEDGYKFQLNEDHISYSIVGYVGSAKNIVIPDMYQGLPVTRIGNYAFNNRVSIQNIIIPESIVRIDENVFDGCTGLNYHVVDGGRYIGSYVSYDTEKSMEENISNPLYYFAGPDAAEQERNTITEFAVAEGTVIVASHALYHCENLLSVTFPASVAYMGYNAVGWCDKLESVTLPFVGNDGLDEENTHLGWAFGARTKGGNISYVPLSLKAVTVLGGDLIAKGSFYGVDALESITLPFLGHDTQDTQNAYLSYLWDGASYEENIIPQSLTTVTVNGGIVGTGAFYQSTHIETITFGEEITDVEDKAFEGCSGLTDIYFAGSAAEWDDICTADIYNTIIMHFAKNNGGTIGEIEWNYDAATDTLTISGSGMMEDYSTKNLHGRTVTSAPWGVYANSIKTLVICDGVTSVGRNAFYGYSCLKDITIPESVTTISGGAFWYCTSLAKINWKAVSVNDFTDSSSVFYGAGTSGEGIEVVFGDNVQKVSAYVFLDTETVTSVTIGKNVTTIGDAAFSGCSGLTSITIPKNVTTIGAHAFGYCTSLTKINWNAVNVNDLSSNAYVFYEAGSAGDGIDVVFGDSVETIPAYLFDNQSNTGNSPKIISVAIGDNATNIGIYAFDGCKNLTSVTIGKNVTTIGYYAFCGCSGLTTLTIPDSVTTIEGCAFNGCNNLTSVTIGKNVTAINSDAFSSCSSLLSLIIPENVTAVGDGAFRGCGSLTSITIPKNVTTIGDYAFLGCPSLTKINWNAVSVYDLTFNSDVFYKAGINGEGIEVVFGDSVQKIPAYLFYGTEKVTSVTIGKNVTTIGYGAFYDCTSLTKINWNAVSVDDINYSDVFYNAGTNGEGIEVIFGDSVQKIPAYIFYNAHNVTSVTIGKNVTTIGSRAFYNSGDIQRIIVDKENQKYHSDQNCLIETSTKTMMLGCKNSIIPSDGSVTTIGGYAFFVCSGLTSITIPESVTTIGGYAFFVCSGLTSITIPESVTTIGDYAFLGCPSLTKINWNAVSVDNLTYGSNVFSNAGTNGEGIEVIFGESVQKIPAYLFDVSYASDRPKVTSVIIGKNVTTIGDYAFYGCSGLTSITIPENVTTIGNWAFCNCTSLTKINWNAVSVYDLTFNSNVFYKAGINGEGIEVVFGDSVQKIPAYIFYNAHNVTSVTIGKNVTTIGGYAFSGCSGITVAYYCGTKTEWSEKVTVGAGNTYLIDKLTFDREDILDTTISMHSPSDSVSSVKKKDALEEKTDIPQPETASSEGLAYSSNGDGTCIVTGIGTYTGTNLEIPAYSPNGDLVTTIKNNAFYGCSGLTSITIPESVTTIGDWAFYNCTSLTKINWNAVSMKDFTYNSYVFYKAGTNGEGIEVIFGDSVQKIPAYLFYDTSSNYGPKVTTVTIGKNVTTIGRYAFYGCSGLTSITIPESVTTIGGGAFYNCTSLTKINWNAVSVNDFISSSDVFYNAGTNGEGIEVIFGDSVQKIPAYLFYVSYGNSRPKVTSVIIGKNVTIIGDDAFRGCSGLTSITIPENVTTIGDYAFYGCSGLTSITIPENVTTIGECAFSYCTSLTKINWNAVSVYDLTSNSYVFHNAGTNGEGIEVIFGDSVQKVPAYLFLSYGRPKVTTVTIGKNVATIGGYAFYNCPSLTKINWNAVSVNNFTSSSDVFYNAGTNGEGIEVIFGDSVQKIPAYLFYDTEKVTSVTIGKNVTTIGNRAFYNSGNIQRIIADKENLKYHSDQNCLIETSTKTLILGCKTSMIPTDGSVTTIGDRAFYGCSGLTSITIPEKVTTIGCQAFYGCTSLTKINWDAVSVNGFTYNSNVFHNAGTNGEGIDIIFGSGVEKIPSNVLNLNYYSSDQPKIASVTVPDTVTSIGMYAFTGCTCEVLLQITSIDKWIESTYWINSAFSLDCARKIILNGEHITELLLPNTLAGIGSMAFAGCSYLTKITYDGELNEWRHVVKASNWDDGCNYEFDCRENSGILFETDDELTEFYVSGYRGSNIELSLPEQYSGRAVTQIYDGAFYGNQILQSLTVPDTVAYIGSNVLTNCRSIQTLTIPYIGSTVGSDDCEYFGYLFGADSYSETADVVPASLKTVTLYQGTALPSYAFYGCSGLQEIILPEGLTDIGDYAFSGCSSVASFAIPDTVTHVGIMILDGCSGIKTVYIGASLEAIDDHDGSIEVEGEKKRIENPLFGISKLNSSLTAYTVSPENKTFVADNNGILYRQMLIPYTDRETYVKVSVVDAPANANLSQYVFPDHIVEIEPYAFANHRSLYSVNLEYIRMIGKNAFYGCGKLNDVTFGKPEKIEYDFINTIDRSEIQYSQYVGDGAFMGCSALQKVNIDTDMLIGIGEQAFYDCSSLKTVIIGNNIQVIGSQAFGSSYAAGSKLERFEVKDGNRYFKSIAGVLYRVLENGDLMLIHYPANLPELDITVKDGKVVSQAVRYENHTVRYVENFTLPTVCDDGETEANIVSLDSYAFRTAKHLKKVELCPENKLSVGDYAFSGSSVEYVVIGGNVTSLGLKRGEGEYTVFADCDYLEYIVVSYQNPYYKSSGGVLFDKKQTKLIKYPAAKSGNHYTLPTTVSTIASMAFKDNRNLMTVEIPSYISAVGLEAFYHCSNLAVIFFNRIYAPKAVMENAFTTYYPSETIIGYTDSYYNDGDGINDYGWENYSDAYTLRSMDSIPDVDVSDNNDYYAIVVVDENGKSMNGVEKNGILEPLIVSLTDPDGKTETVETGKDENGIGDGVAVFYNMQGNINLGFAIDYDAPYQLRVTDTTGTYFPFVSKELYLDYDTRITYVTLTKSRDVYGLNCGNNDINTETFTLNKAEYGTKTRLIDKTKGYEESNIEYVPETVEISVIAYANDVTIVSDVTRLLQNGNEIPNVQISKDENGFDKIIYEDGSVTVYFEVPVDSLIAEVPIECNVGIQKEGFHAVSKAFLNIDVIDFNLTEDDINLDSTELSVDLSQSGEVLTKLLGSNSWDFNLGKNLAMGVNVDGDKVTLSLNAAYSASKEKKSSASDYGNNYQAGYYANITGSTGRTWEFDRYGVIFDENGKMHTYKMIIRVAHATKDLGYCYYRCYIWEGEYSNKQALWYGAIKMPEGSTLSGSRSAYSLKADVIYLTYFAEANAKQDITKGFKYIEPITTDFTPGIVKDYTTKNSFDATLYGDITFQYQKGKGLVPVNSYIKGEIKYTFEHEQQFVVWVIPVFIQVKVQLDGKVELSLKYDEWRSVSIDEAKMTLSAEITAKAGIGCKIISAGVNGSIGTVFILNFAPQFGVEKWTVSGKFGVYATYYTLKWKKAGWFPYPVYPVFEQTTSEATLFDKTWTIIDNTNGETNPEQEEAVKLQSVMLASMFMTDYYEPADPSECDEQATLFAIGDDLYKVYYVNRLETISDEESGQYDSYNYKKLTVAKWDDEAAEWSQLNFVDSQGKSQPYYIDDNGFNDLEYELYASEDQISLVFTQQTEKTNAESAEDVSDYVSDLVIKYVDLSNIGNLSNEASLASVYAVKNSTYYKYFVSTATVAGKQTMVWAENTDNNIFGVSPNNYVDSNREVHIYPTTANSIWISTQNANGTWTSPVCIADGLAPIADLAISEDGYVYYIIDENCDLSDVDDQKMYAISGDGEAMEIADGANVTGILPSGDGILYALTTEEENGLQYLNQKETNKTLSLPEDTASYADDCKVIYNQQNQPLAIIYTDNTSWENNIGETVSGSTLYGVFRNGEAWGSPVEIRTESIKPKENLYISNYDVLVKPGTTNTLLLDVEYIENKTGTDGEAYSEYTQTTDQYVMQSDIVVDDVQIDYTNREMTVSVHNAGAKSADVLTKVEEGSAVTAYSDLLSGQSCTFIVDLSGNGLTPTVRIYSDSSDNKAVKTVKTDLNYSDLQPFVKQLLLGENNTLLVAIRNNGNVSGSGTVYVNIGNHTAEDVSENAVQRSIYSLKPGGILYYEIPLSGFELDDNTIFTVYIDSEKNAFAEKGNCGENNILYTTLQRFESDVNEDGSSYKPEIDVHMVTFDLQKPEDIVLKYSCSDTDSLLSVKRNNAVLQPDDYSVDTDNGTITIYKEYLETIDGGEYTLTLSFMSGCTVNVSLKVKIYHTVYWKNYDGELLGQNTVEAGMIPKCEITPNRESTESIDYTFIGWSDTLDNKAKQLPAVESDLTLYAVFSESDRNYEVTWVMQMSDGETVTSTEKYRYGDTPKYLGKEIAPDGLQFDGWDKEYTPVFENCVYQAVYIDPSIPEYLLGDVNGDGEIDAADAGLISRYDAGFIVLSGDKLLAGDVNHDGEVDAADAGLISRYDAGFIKSLS